MFSTNKLRAQVALRGGFAYSNKYLVTFTRVPDGLISSSARTLQYLCENTSLPTRSIQAQDKIIYGTSYQMPYKHAYGEISMTFYLTEDMQSKAFFDTWLNLIVDPDTGDIGYYDKYCGTVRIGMYGRDVEDPNSATPVYEVELENIWPSFVAEVAMTHASGGEIAKLPVTFQYKRWKVTEAPAATTAIQDVQNLTGTTTGF